MDYVGPLINNFRMNSTIYQRFRKRWGVDVDGIHYSHKLKFYTGGEVVEDEGLDRFLKAIGTSCKSLKDNDYDEVEQAWFYFNRNKTPSGDITNLVNPPELATTLNATLIIGTKYQVKLVYGGPTQRVLPEFTDIWGINDAGEIESEGFNTVALMERLFSSPWKYIANITVSADEYREVVGFNTVNTGDVSIAANLAPEFIVGKTTTPVTIATSLDNSFGVLSLVDSSESCFVSTKDSQGNKIIIDSGFITYSQADENPPEELFDTNGDLIISDVKNTSDFALAGVSLGYYEVYEFEYTGADEDSMLIQDIDTYTSYITNRKRENIIIDTTIKHSMYDLHMNSLTEEELAEHSYWGEYFSNGKLIKDKVDSMKRYEFVSMVAECLDTDFKAEEASWWEKLLAIIIFIAAIVVTLFTAGVLGPSAFSLASLAMGLGYGALVLTVGGIILSQMGLSAMRLVRIIGQVAQIIGLAASITGIMAVVQNAFKKFALKALDEGLINAVSEYTVEMFVKDVVVNVIDNVSNNILSVLDIITNPMKVLFGTTTSFAEMSISGFIGRLKQGLSVYMKLANNSASKPDTVNEDQLEKTSFQFPEQMYALQEQTVYEPDALQAMSILKDQQFGGQKTEQFMEQIS